MYTMTTVRTQLSTLAVTLLAAAAAGCAASVNAEVSTTATTTGQATTVQAASSAAHCTNPFLGPVSTCRPAPVVLALETTTVAGSAERAEIDLVPVYFEHDSAELGPRERRELASVAEQLKALPEVSLTIEGHCDERGSAAYNLKLGERRALAVREYLTSLGVNPAGLVIISYGKQHPAIDGDDEQAWAKNRRVELVKNQ